MDKSKPYGTDYYYGYYYGAAAAAPVRTPSQQAEYNQATFGIPQNAGNAAAPTPGSVILRENLTQICADHQRNVSRVANAVALLDLLDRYDVQRAFDLAGQIV